MKKSKVILFVIISILCSCSSEDSSYKYIIDYIPCENEDSSTEEYVFLDKNGESYSIIFDKEITPVINGYFALKEDNNFVLCRLNGNSYEMLPNAKGLFDIGVMNNGLIPVCRQDECIQVLDSEGNLKFTLADVDGVEVNNCFSYSSGKMRVELVDEKFVYVDEDGRNSFDKSFEWATDFHNGYAIVGVGNDKFQLINESGESLLSFICHDPESLIFSTKYKKIAAKDDKDIFTIYNFDGKFIYLPKMVQGVYALLEDEFIFEYEDKYGLMSYGDSREKIYAKYDQLVPNGSYYLGIPYNNDEIVKLLDSNGIELDSFDGEEIFCLSTYGYDFPNIIIRPDGQFFLVDAKGRRSEQPLNFDIDFSEIKKASVVHNYYFPPQNEISKKILNLCGDGIGASVNDGAFFYKNERHCNPNDIKYFRETHDLSKFRGESIENYIVESSVNYLIALQYEFDEPIVKSNPDTLNMNAWLKYEVVSLLTYNLVYTFCIYSEIIHDLKDKGCEELYSDRYGCILASPNSENVMIIRNEYYKMSITMCSHNGFNLSIWEEIMKNRVHSS
ncbi:MAG: hypothetical protein J1E63_02870 [Muribaculaceae bacterium]|nr:hypothetical protein [Muribaculaceae bacterium]